MNKEEKARVSSYYTKNPDIAASSIKIAVAIIVVTFLISMSITLAIPAFPPAQLFCGILNFPSAGLSFGGISVTTILNSSINGLFWAFIATVAYGVARQPKKYEPLFPMPTAYPLPTPPIAPQTVDACTIPISVFPAARERQSLTKEDRLIVEAIRMEKETEEDAELEEDVQVEDDIEMIKGMDSICAELLRNAGIKTIEDLLRIGATEPERQNLAKEVGVTYATLDRWICRGDLIRIRGIGKKYSTLLELIGVNTVSDLSTRNPHNLLQTLRAIYLTTNVMVKLPSLKKVELWVQNAKNCSTIEVWVQNSKELAPAVSDEPELIKHNMVPQCRNTTKDARSTDCQHWLGYLNKKNKDEQIPQECLECEKVIECVLSQYYESAAAISEIKKWY